MRGFLEITGLGNVGRDPETKYSANGDAITSFSVASTESFKDKSGQKQDRTTWITCTAFGKLAEICSEWIKKGNPIFYKGDLRIEEWEAQDGTKKTAVKCVLKEIRLLGDGKGRDAQAPASSQQSQRPAQREAPPADPRDMPPF